MTTPTRKQRPAGGRERRDSKYDPIVIACVRKISTPADFQRRPYLALTLAMSFGETSQFSMYPHKAQTWSHGFDCREHIPSADADQVTRASCFALPRHENDVLRLALRAPFRGLHRDRLSIARENAMTHIHGTVHNRRPPLFGQPHPDHRDREWAHRPSGPCDIAHALVREVLVRFSFIEGKDYECHASSPRLIELKYPRSGRQRDPAAGCVCQPAPCRC